MVPPGNSGGVVVKPDELELLRYRPRSGQGNGLQAHRVRQERSPAR